MLKEMRSRAGKIIVCHIFVDGCCYVISTTFDGKKSLEYIVKRVVN